MARLVGAPPGYVGYGDGGLLTEAVRWVMVAACVCNTVLMHLMQSYSCSECNLRCFPK